MTNPEPRNESHRRTRGDLWVILATQGFLLVALAFWYGTYLTDQSAYFWAVPGALAGGFFTLLYARSRGAPSKR